MAWRKAQRLHHHAFVVRDQEAPNNTDRNAGAVNEEARDLKAAGADVVQIDEPWLQARPDRAARYGVKAINRALAGIPGPTAAHLCFGYAATVADRPRGYAFLPELADSAADQISIEAAQPKLDLAVLGELAPTTVVLGVLDLGDPSVEDAAEVARRIRAGLRHVSADRLVPAPDCFMKPPAPDRLRQAARPGRGRGAGPARADLTGEPRVRYREGNPPTMLARQGG